MYINITNLVNVADLISGSTAAEQTAMTRLNALINSHSNMPVLATGVSLPTASLENFGKVYYDTDSGNIVISNGQNWKQVTTANFAYTPTLPAVLEEDQFLFLDPRTALSGSWANTTQSSAVSSLLNYNVSSVTFESYNSTQRGLIMTANSLIQASVARANPSYSGAEDRMGTDYNGSRTSSYSVCFWVKTTTTTADSGSYIHGMGLTGDVNNDGGVSIGISSGYPEWFHNATGWAKKFAATSVADGVWHLVVWTYDNGSLKIYIDGVLDSNFTGTVDGDYNASFVFDYIGTALADSEFIGVLGAVRGFTKVLTLSEIADVFNVEAALYEKTTI